MNPCHLLEKYLSSTKINNTLVSLNGKSGCYRKDYDYLKNQLPNTSFAFSPYGLYGTFKNFTAEQKKIMADSNLIIEDEQNNYLFGYPFSFLCNSPDQIDINKNTLKYIVYYVLQEIKKGMSIQMTTLNDFTIFSLDVHNMQIYCNDDNIDYYDIQKIFICRKNTGGIYVLGQKANIKYDTREVTDNIIKSCHFDNDINEEGDFWPLLDNIRYRHHKNYCYQYYL